MLQKSFFSHALLEVITINNADSFLTARYYHPSLFETMNIINCFKQLELRFET